MSESEQSITVPNTCTMKSSSSFPLPHLSSSSATSSTTDLDDKRSTWSRQLDFFLSCVGYAVGLGNIWRFPYLCYKSGGGAFLIPYLIFLVICGMPLFFLEMSLGQFGSLGPIAIWKISPIFKGLGFGMAIVSGVVCVYYNVIIGWALYYIYQSYYVSWSSCENSWNTPNCISTDISNAQLNISAINQTEIQKYTNSSLYFGSGTKMTSSEEFWLFNVLQQSAGIENVGSFQWPLVLSLFIAWMVVFLCVLKGIQSSGKVVYVTATFPYVVLLCLLGRGLTLPGAWNGIYFYLTPQWEKLLTFKVWGDAATQIFYSVGAAWGALLTMASYNKFNNNVYRDSMVVPLINCGTSIFAGFVVFSVVGFMAHETGMSIEDVVSEGPGLAFIVYPEAISRLPVSPIWAFLFFFMLFAVGLDTQFGMFETAVSAFVDEYPNIRKRKTLFTAFLCLAMFILGLPCVTQGGMYVFQLMDWYSAAFSLMVISLLETVAVSWVYGVDRFIHDISLMTKKMPSVWWKLCWQYITPATIIALLIFILVNHTAITYNNYVYPTWSIGVGWIIATCSITPIPVVAAYVLYKAKGNSFMKKLVNSLRPSPDWGPALEEHRIQYKKSISLVSSRFEQRFIERVSSSNSVKNLNVDPEELSEILPFQSETVL